MAEVDVDNRGEAPAWTLPRLTGGRRRAAAILYIVVAGFGLVVALSGVAVNGIDTFRNVPATAQFGLRTRTLPDGSSAIAVADPAARAAGVERLDRLIAVNGAPLPDKASEFVVGKRLDAAGGERVRLDLRDERGHVRRVTLARSAERWTRPDPYTGLPVWIFATAQYGSDMLPSLFLLFASWMLYRRRPSDPIAMVLALGFALLSNSISEGFGAQVLLGVPPLALDLLKVAGWMAVFLGITGFPDGRIDNRWAKLVAILVVPEFVLSHAAVVLDAGPSILLITALLDMALTALALVAVMMRYRALPPGIARQQIKWAVTGFGVMVMALLVQFALPILFENAVLVEGPRFVLLCALRMLGLCALPGGLLVSVLRYRLYDVDAAISRSIAYGIMTIALLAIFAGSEKLIEVLGEHYFGEQLGAIASGLSAAIAAVMIVPLHHRATHWAEHRFQRALIKLRQGLPVLVGDLRETSDVDTIADVVLDEVAQGVRADHAALIVAGRTIAARGVAPETAAAWQATWAQPDSPGLSCDRHDALFPVRVPLAATGHGRVGWLVLGPRPDGSLYGKDERETLVEVADPVARALAIAERRQRRDADLDGRIATLSAALAALRQDVASLTLKADTPI